MVLEITKTDERILNTIKSLVDCRGICCSSNDQLIRRAEVKIGTLNRSLKRLEDVGLIRRETFTELVGSRFLSSRKIFILE